MIKLLCTTSLLITSTLSSSLSTCTQHSDCPSLNARCFFANGQRDTNGVCFDQEKMNALSTSTSTSTSTTTTEMNFLEVDELTSKNSPGSGSMKLQAPEGSSATLKLGAESYSVGVSADGDFNVQLNGAPEPYLSFKADGRLTTKILKMSANNIDAKSGFAVQDSSGNTIRQWSTIASDIFSSNDIQDKNKGWGLETSDGGMNLGVTTCGGVTMLGGPSDGDAASGFHRGEVSKTFGNLRNHSFVRISASFHFIDLWLGEFAYMKISSGSKAAASSGDSAAVVDEYVWSKAYHAASGMGNADHKHPPSGVNICGDPNVVEMDFVSNIDVSVPHNMDWVKVTFGTKLPPTASAAVGGASWGVSRVDVMIKNVDESQL